MLLRGKTGACFVGDPGVVVLLGTKLLATSSKPILVVGDTRIFVALIATPNFGNTFQGWVQFPFLVAL